jgi:hypothetical protein
MNDLFNDRPEGSDEAEAEKGEAGDDEDEIQFDEEDFFNYFDQTIEKLNEAKASSFQEENKNDTYRRSKEQMNKLYLTGRFNNIKGEFARKVLGNEYRIDPTGGQDSKEFISRSDIPKHKLTFDGTIVGYVGTDENKKSAGSVTEFKNLYEKVRIKHKKKS